MTPLRLTPLPVLRSNDEAGSLMIETEGFVDEAAISALVFGAVTNSRQATYPEDLALAADDLDFAGWKLTPAPHPRLTEPLSQTKTPVRRPAPPEIEQPGLGQPYSGSHRWWLAGLAGVLSTMLFYLLLLNLSSRPGTHFEVFFAPRPHAVEQPASVDKNAEPKVSAELTTLSNDRP
ncbi:MAG: hypothetical protein ABIT37_18575 [Luteolibacter sp.]